MVGGGHIVWKAPQCVSHKKMSSVLSGILCAINTRSMIFPKPSNNKTALHFDVFELFSCSLTSFFSLPVSFGIHVKYGTFRLFKAVFDKATYQFKISQCFQIKLSSCYFHQGLSTRCHREPSSQATHIGASSPFPRPVHFHL